MASGLAIAARGQCVEVECFCQISKHRLTYHAWEGHVVCRLGKFVLRDLPHFRRFARKPEQWSLMSRLVADHLENNRLYSFHPDVCEIFDAAGPSAFLQLEEDCPYLVRRSGKKKGTCFADVMELSSTFQSDYEFYLRRKRHEPFNCGYWEGTKHFVSMYATGKNIKEVLYAQERGGLREMVL